MVHCQLPTRRPVWESSLRSQKLSPKTPRQETLSLSSLSPGLRASKWGACPPPQHSDNTRFHHGSQRAPYTVLNFCSEHPAEATGKRACGEQETWALGLPGPALHSRGALPPSPVTGCEDQTARGVQPEFELTLSSYLSSSVLFSHF